MKRKTMSQATGEQRAASSEQRALQGTRLPSTAATSRCTAKQYQRRSGPSTEHCDDVTAHVFGQPVGKHLGGCGEPSAVAPLASAPGAPYGVSLTVSTPIGGNPALRLRADTHPARESEIQPGMATGGDEGREAPKTLVGGESRVTAGTCVGARSGRERERPSFL